MNGPNFKGKDYLIYHANKNLLSPSKTFQEKSHKLESNSNNYKNGISNLKRNIFLSKIKKNNCPGELSKLSKDKIIWSFWKSKIALRSKQTDKINQNSLKWKDKTTQTLI